MASDIKKSVLIIGAGPAGLTLAYELLSRSDQFDVTVLEKQEIVGGLAQTYNHKGNRIDIGGHRFFSKDQRVMDRWFAQMSLQGAEAWDYKKLGIVSEVASGGPDPDKEDVVILARRRLSRIFWNRKFFDYPLSITRDTISKFGLMDLVQSGFSYIIAKFKTYDMTNLEGFYKSRFGERLYDRFFNAYTHKVRGKRPKDISSARGAQRVKGLNLGKAVRDYFKKMIIGNRQSTQTETSLIGKFYYPKLGPGQMREVVAQRVQDLGGKIIFGADFAGGLITSNEQGSSNIPDEAQRVVGKRNHVCAMPVTKNGNILLQLRDMGAPTMAGQMSSFGGKVEEGESIFEGLQRELNEELEMKITKDNVRYLGNKRTMIGDMEVYDHIYEVTGFDGQQLTLHEGEKIMELTPQEALVHEKTAESAKTNIQYFINNRLVVATGGHAIQSISYTKDGQIVAVQPDIVVSTAPIKELMTRFEGADPEVVRLSNLLEYRDFITVGILAKKLLVHNTSNHKTINNIIPDNRLYIHDKGTTVGRIQVFNNRSPYMVADPDTIWIGLEYFCDKSDDIWNMSDDKMIEFAVKELESMQLLDKADYLDGVVRRMEYTYPCYFGEGYDKFNHIKTYLDSIGNLYCVGRNGAHRYNNQDHSMLSSMKLADMLISGTIDRSILRSVNTEEEYHESGKK